MAQAVGVAGDTVRRGRAELQEPQAPALETAAQDIESVTGKHTYIPPS